MPSEIGPRSARLSQSTKVRLESNLQRQTCHRDMEASMLISSKFSAFLSSLSNKTLLTDISVLLHLSTASSVRLSTLWPNCFSSMPWRSGESYRGFWCTGRNGRAARTCSSDEEEVGGREAALMSFLQPDFKRKYVRLVVKTLSVGARTQQTLSSHP